MKTKVKTKKKLSQQELEAKRCDAKYAAFCAGRTDNKHNEWQPIKSK